MRKIVAPVLLVTTFITILTRCKKAVNNTGIETWLIFKFKSDSAQTRLNNIGQTKGWPTADGNRAKENRWLIWASVE
jgi:hypothetical protein